MSLNLKLTHTQPDCNSIILIESTNNGAFNGDVQTWWMNQPSSIYLYSSTVQFNGQNPNPNVGDVYTIYGNNVALGSYTVLTGNDIEDVLIGICSAINSNTGLGYVVKASYDIDTNIITLLSSNNTVEITTSVSSSFDVVVDYNISKFVPGRFGTYYFTDVLITDISNKQTNGFVKIYYGTTLICDVAINYAWDVDEIKDAIYAYLNTQTAEPKIVINNAVKTANTWAITLQYVPNPFSADVPTEKLTVVQTEYSNLTVLTNDSIKQPSVVTDTLSTDMLGWKANDVFDYYVTGIDLPTAPAGGKAYIDTNTSAIAKGIPANTLLPVYLTNDVTNGIKLSGVVLDDGYYYIKYIKTVSGYSDGVYIYSLTNTSTPIAIDYNTSVATKVYYKINRYFPVRLTCTINGEEDTAIDLSQMLIDKLIATPNPNTSYNAIRLELNSTILLTGSTSLPDGLYRFDYTIPTLEAPYTQFSTTGNNTPVVGTTYNIFNTCHIRKCVYNYVAKIWDNYTCNRCDDVYLRKALLMYGLLKSLETSVLCLDVSKARSILEVLKKLCNYNECTNC